MQERVVNPDRDQVNSPGPGLAASVVTDRGAGSLEVEGTKDAAVTGNLATINNNDLNKKSNHGEWLVVQASHDILLPKIRQHSS